MKIQFDQPKYILPLIMTPFIFVIFHLNRGLFAKDTLTSEELVLEQREDFNPNMPQANLDKRSIKSKFDSFKDRFKQREDYTAMLGLEEEEVVEEKVESLYSEEEKHIIDSVNAAIMDGKQRDFMTNVKNHMQSSQRRAVPTVKKAKKEESEYEREMRMFREQMQILDSLTKSPEQQQAEMLAAQRQQQLENEDKRRDSLVDVHKAGINTMAEHFNTIAVETKKQFIRAIVDEELKIQDGSRVRIRLMDDIEAGNYLIEKGTYLFGIVQSFSQQRVNIQVTSILVNDKILPVELTVYDNDGLPGLYVPGSDFRDFTKDLAGNVGGSNIQIDQDPQSQSQLFYSMAQRAMQTSTRAIRKAAHRNKAFLKYNTIVYLVSPEDLNQQTL